MLLSWLKKQVSLGVARMVRRALERQGVREPVKPYLLILFKLLNLFFVLLKHNSSI